MNKAILNTSPLLYLYRIEDIDWLPRIFSEIRVMLEAKNQGIIHSVEPHVEKMKSSGMWISEEVKQRILALAGER